MLKKQRNKPTIKEVVVVEGKTDTNRLNQLFNVVTIETNGSDLKPQTINLIKQASNKSGVILFLDPDYQGEKIRKQIISHLDHYTEAFITNESWKTIKHGVNEASDLAIINALKNKITYDTKIKQSLTWSEYLKLNLNTYQKRFNLANKLKISYANHKQLFKRLNMLELTYNELIKLIDHE
ncbi:MAG: ribonuclease M5 [Mycoplasma sp.]